MCRRRVQSKLLHKNDDDTADRSIVDVLSRKDGPPCLFWKNISRMLLKLGVKDLDEQSLLDHQAACQSILSFIERSLGCFGNIRPLKWKLGKAASQMVESTTPFQFSTDGKAATATLRLVAAFPI